jgi:CBS domain-containing protein
MICPFCGSDNLPGKETCGNCHQDLAPSERPVPTNAVERCLMEDRVGALKTRQPILVAPDATIAAALAMMLANNVGALLVVGGDGKLLGILTERDLLKKVAGLRDDYDTLPVRDVMTARPESVATTATLNYVLHRMDAGGYRHVPVLDGGKPVGIVSVRAMLRHIVDLCKE